MSTGSYVRVELAHDQRGRALAEIAALSILRMPEVERFRGDVLGGRSLAPSEIDKWADEQKHAVERTSKPITVWLPSGPNWPTSARPINAPRESVFGRLYDAADEAAHCLGWILNRSDDVLQARCAGLVLTGKLDLPRAILTVNRRRMFSELNTMTITLGTRVSQKELLDLYNRGRRELGRRGRDIREPWRAELAIFVEEMKPGRTWRATMEIWNQKRPERSYESVRRFAADCRDSYRRITGDDIEWHWRHSLPNEDEGTEGEAHD